MKRLLKLIILMLLVNQTMGQMINVNPDPDGEPWIAGGVPPLSEEGEKRLAEMPIFKPSIRTGRAIPSKTDNSQHKFFRPIFNQEGNSCAQASGIGYILTYEFARVRNLDATLSENWYPSHFTWHFVNEGKNVGSWPYEGWDIVEKMGCPTYADFGGAMNGNDPTWTKWMTGYSRYRNGMKNRVKSQGIIDNIETTEGLDILKQYLSDYGSGQSVGGIVSFSALSSGYTDKKVGTGIHSGEMIITRWGTGGAHMMTIVGYDDSVKVDINNDGRYTNTEDINDDGEVNMLDWEIGALKMANSWGNSWGDSGFAWISYSCIGYGIADKYDAQKNGGLYRNRVFYIEVDNDHVEQQSIKLKMTYDDRFSLTLIAGVSQDTNATTPDSIDTIPIFYPASSKGEVLPMRGKDNFEAIEIGFDITNLIEKINSSGNYKLFLTIDHPNAATGTIDKVGLVDHSDNDKEYYSVTTNKVLNSSGVTEITLIKNGKGVSNEMNDPEFVSCNTLKALVGSPIKLSVVVADESKMQSVTATYEIIGEATETITLSQVLSQNGTFTFTGSIPEQNEKASGTITFTMTDEFGNSESTLLKQIVWDNSFELKYDNENNKKLGNRDGDTYIAAIRLTKDELTPFYDSGKLTMLKFFLTNGHHIKWIDTVEAKVYCGTGDTPSKEIYSKVLDHTSEIQFDEWTTHFPDSQITLSNGYSYWVGYRIVFRFGWFVGFESCIPDNGKSNIIYWKDQWTTLSDLDWGVDGAWNIRAVVEESITAEFPKLLTLKELRQERTTPMTLSALCGDNKSVNKVTAEYRLQNGDFKSIELAASSSNGKLTTFTGEIPAPNYSTNAEVRCIILDSDGNKTISPLQKAKWISENEIHYDGDHKNNIGRGTGDRFVPTIRLTPEMFPSNEENKVISGVRFFIDPKSGISNIKNLTVKIFESSTTATEPDKQIYSYDFTDELTSDGWQEHILSEFVERKTETDYWIAYDIDFSTGFFCGKSDDSAGTTPDNAHLIYYREKWITLKDWGHENSQWNIRALVEGDKPVSKFTHAKTITTNFGLNNIIQNGSQLKFNILLPKNGNVGIKILNIKGQELRNVTMNNLNEGFHSLGINTQTLSHGIYIYRITLEKQKLQGKCLVK